MPQRALGRFRLALAVALLCAGLAACAPAGGDKGAAPAAGPAGDLDLRGLPLPAKLLGLQRGEMTDHEKDNPGAGVSAPYAGPGIAATVYVYDHGQPGQPDNPESPAMQEEFRQAIAQAHIWVDLGQAKSVDLLEVWAIPRPRLGIEYLCAQLRIVDQAGDYDSYIFLAPYSGQFLKIRFTTPADPRSDKLAQVFATTVAKLAWPERYAP
jgi:hypothetical protein